MRLGTKTIQTREEIAGIDIRETGFSFGLANSLVKRVLALMAACLVLANIPTGVLAEDTSNSSRVLLSDTQGAAKLTLSENSNRASVLEIAGAIDDQDFKVLRLENPDRLVVDINNLQVENGKVIAVQGSDLVQQVRYGNHLGTGRIVLDLNKNVDYQVQGENGVISLSFSGRVGIADSDGSNQGSLASLKNVEPQLPSAKDLIVPDSFAREQNLSALKKLQVALVETEAAKPVAEIPVAEPVTELAETLPVSSKAKNLSHVTDVSLQSKNAGENFIVARMDSPGIYTFERSAPSEYVLTLEEAAIKEGVKTSIIAGAGAGSIRSVRAVQQGDLVKLRIFADPLADLEAKTEKGAIIVSARKEAFLNPEKVMAQAELGELLEGEQPADSTAAANPAETDGTDASSEVLAGETDLTGLLGSDTTYTGRLISLDLQDTEIDNALRIIAEVSNLNIIASDNVTGKVTLRLIDVPWDQALDVILKTNGLDKVQEGNVVRIAPIEKLRAEREALRQAQQAEDELEPLRVQYMRISYAKAAELQALVETVLTERGAVSHDARTNQLIVKDIAKGIKNAARLVQKLDLRTPQVLIETQIIEAQRSFVRDLGSELGFTFIRSPETGNALGYNFPNSVAIGGSAQDTRGDTAADVSPIASFFPSLTPSSAVSALFGSADGTRSLDVRISAAEAEGRARVVSRPSVAVTNNSPAVIKSVEKLRIRLPSGGVSVATGQGAAAGAGGSVATETIEVGIVLNVTAQASPDYYVLLDIDAKSSSLGTLSEAVDDVPPEIERSTTSTVLVSSGQTFAMGGIYRVAEDSSIVGVPFLKDIPVLGSFFRRTGVNDRDEELIFFITPRIIEGSFDDAAMKAAS